MIAHRLQADELKDYNQRGDGEPEGVIHVFCKVKGTISVSVC